MESRKVGKIAGVVCYFMLMLSFTSFYIILTFRSGFASPATCNQVLSRDPVLSSPSRFEDNFFSSSG